ncbi:LytR/AlgR family response regulator transcription factor [Cecembia calidifontis]|jgi:DNA-binding LytR/AlgR family response regulator|uniref:LytTR family two component transcriptional regulator n=1 Tax=Cecembia calidifontis TaxID=1187080 RepID=A0A4Q7PAP1_9BACT|nr:LytTR family DNA-binding domain-containing protein [Cecembia calidifontis]RZS97027.1 LytTR family two component transcriptional regulator [Cecembia calidifontis]
MRVLIVEDEPLTFQRIVSVLSELRPGWNILSQIQTVKELIEKLDGDFSFDLILCDIHLADGLSFSALKGRNLDVPIIFITAYDQYALNSFEHYCLDYVLKPIDPQRLEKAITKVEKVWNKDGFDKISPGFIDQLLSKYQQKNYKRRFLAKSGNKLHFVPVENIACFYVENGLTYIEEHLSGKKSIVDLSLQELENGLLDPLRFYRVNRSMIINIDHLVEMKPYVNGRLLLNISSLNQKKIIVARERVSEFKIWINQ